MVKRIYCLQQFDAGIEFRYQIDELLEPLQRQFFQMIDNHGGGRIGMKKALWQMLIEHAFKFKEYYDYDAPQEMEFLMYDKPVENKCHRTSTPRTMMVGLLLLSLLCWLKQ